MAASRRAIADLAAKVDHLTHLADIQMQRIAQIQAELDQLPHARRRRQRMLKAFLRVKVATGSNGHNP